MSAMIYAFRLSSSSCYEKGLKVNVNLHWKNAFSNICANLYKNSTNTSFV